MTDLAKGKFIKHSCRYFSDIYISEVGNKTKPLFITLGANSLPFIEWCPELTLFSLLNFGVFLLLDTPIPSYPKLFIHNKQSLMRELSPFAASEFWSARIDWISPNRLHLNSDVSTRSIRWTLLLLRRVYKSCEPIIMEL